MAKGIKPPSKKKMDKLLKRVKDIKDIESNKRKYKPRIPAGVLFDAVDTDMEEGRMRKTGRGTRSTTFDPVKRKKKRGKTQSKSVGGNIMGAIRNRAKKAGFMTGKDDMRDIKEYLINERNKKMFDDAEKKTKKTKKKKRPTTKSGSNRIIRRGKKGDGISESALRRARKAASRLNMKKGGYTSQNKKYGGGIYPKMGK